MERPIERVLAKLKNVASSGDTGRQWVSCCPAHDDNRRSFSVAVDGDDTVYLHCHAGCDKAAVLAALDLEKKDLYVGWKSKEEPRGATIARLAFFKNLPDSWLRTVCGLRDVGGEDDRKIEIPYLDVDGEEACTRVRSAIRAKDGSFWKVRGSKPILYGLWLLSEFRKRGGPLILVEGETDCWALWLHGFNALGVPGASAQRSLGDGSALSGFDTVYLWREPDAAGGEFVGRMIERLKASGYAGKVLVVSAEGAKDPADIQARYRDEFPEAFRGILATATPPPADAAVSSANSGILPQTVRRIEDQLRRDGVCAWGQFEFTDSGNAGRLEHLHGADLRYVKSWNEWYVWDGKRWAPDYTLEVYRRADRTVLTLPLEATLASGMSGRNDCLKWFDRSQSAKAIASMIGLVRSAGRVPANHDQFDRQPWLLNCPNGTIDLRTGDLRKHRREDLLTTLCPTAFDDAAECPTWVRFLDTVFPADQSDPAAGGNVSLIAFVQKLLGYCLTGVVLTNLLPIFWGAGSNGKSTMLDVVQDVVGSAYTMQAPPGMLMARSGDQHPTELADLFGKRLVVATETAQNRRLDEALVKQLTGGDKIRARRMRENFWEFSPTHKLIQCTNHKPRVRGNDHGIWRRLLLVPFLVRFWDPDKGETGPEHLRQDKGLKEKLRAEGPGILAWLVAGCRAWQAEGLEQPADVKDVTSEYRSEQDTLGQFLADNYVQSSSQHNYVTLSEFAKGFAVWLEDNGERPWGNRAVGDELRNRGFTIKVGHARQNNILGLNPRSTKTSSFSTDDID